MEAHGREDLDDRVNEEKNHLRGFGRHAVKLSCIGIALFGYAALSFISLFATYDIKSNVEEFKPRVRHEMRSTSGDKDGYYGKAAQAAYDFSMFPWKKIGLVTDERYIATRRKSLDMAGIDEFNPADDGKRFALYRELGFAVRKSDDYENAMYVPFKSWIDFIKRNSGTLKGLDEWTEVLGPQKEHSIKLGRAYFKADSVLQGGNENGVADGGEWHNALNQMGYATIHDMAEGVVVLVQSAPPNLNDLLARFITEIPGKSAKGMVVDNIDKVRGIPIKRLEGYLN